VFAMVTSSRTMQRDERLGRASVGLQTDLVRSHLALEEQVSTGGGFPSDVFDPLDHAIDSCAALLDGGTVDGMKLDAVKDPTITPTLGEFCDILPQIRQLTAQRLISRAEIGSPVSTRYEELLERAVSLSLEHRQTVLARLGRDADALERLNRIVIGIVVALFAVLAWFVRRQHRSIRRLNEQSDLILNTVAEGIYGLDAEGRTRFVNEAAARMTGHDPRALLGRRPHDLVHHTKDDGSRYPAEECPALKAITSGEPQHVDGELYWRSDGTSFPVEFTAVPTVEDGRVTGAVVTFRDVTERLEVQRLKDEFTSLVSHELRTPLSSIRGALGLIASGVMGDLSERGKRMVEIAASNSDRLVRLINDLLDMERMESGLATLQKRRTSTAPLVRQAVDGIRPMADEAGVGLEASPAEFPVVADPDRIVQALTNLLSNAIKFSPPKASVTVSVERSRDDVVIRVRDRGRGIPQDKLDSIFERFHQVDSSDSREKGGTGLGLAICRSIVEQHGGRIWAESTPGAGAVFSFTLPVSASAVEGDGHGATILVCDDDPEIVEGVSEMLRRGGYRTIGAGSGEEAVERALAERPNAILLDLVMGGVDGWQTLSLLKERPETRDIPVVAVSGVARDDGGEHKARFVDWVDKPVDEAVLLRALRRALPSASGHTVLIVEDDGDLAGILAEVFERHGFVAHRAGTGHEAVEVAGRLAPDLLVLDLMLPEGDGFDVIDRLREDDRLRDVPIVVYTAKDLDTAEERRLQSGEAILFNKGHIAPDEFARRMMSLLAGLVVDSKERRDP
jgi:PAS domain S-box-containing protein